MTGFGTRTDKWSGSVAIMIVVLLILSHIFAPPWKGTTRKETEETFSEHDVFYGYAGGRGCATIIHGDKWDTSEVEVFFHGWGSPKDRDFPSQAAAEAFIEKHWCKP